MVRAAGHGECFIKQSQRDEGKECEEEDSEDARYWAQRGGTTSDRLRSRPDTIESDAARPIANKKGDEAEGDDYSTPPANRKLKRGVPRLSRRLTICRIR